MILVIFLYALCASSFTIAKAVLSYSAPIFFVGVRALLAGIVLSIYAWAYGISLRVDRKDMVDLSIITIFGLYIAYVFDLWSLQFMSSFKSAFFFNLSPFITALLSYFFLGEYVRKKQWLGLLIGFCAMVPIVMQSAPIEGAALLSISIPELVLLTSVIASCMGWIFMKRLLRKGYHFISLNAVSMIGGGLLALSTSALFEEWLLQSPVTNLAAFISLTVAVILVCNVFFSNLYGYLLHRYSATFLSFAGFMCPIFTALFGAIFLHEQVTWHFVLGTIGVFIGLYLFYQDELVTVVN